MSRRKEKNLTDSLQINRFFLLFFCTAIGASLLSLMDGRHYDIPECLKKDAVGVALTIVTLLLLNGFYNR